MNAPYFSIIMPAYNGERFIDAAISSVLNQTFRDFELIVSDDGSADSTATLVSLYAERDARVRLVRRQQHGGAGGNRNFAIRHALGEWVAFLDCDDVWPSDNLALFRDAIAACPEAALFFGDYRRFIEDIDDAGPSALEARAFFDANAHYVHEFSSLASGVELFRMRSTHLLKHCCLHYCPISTSAVVLNRNVLLSNDIAFREDWMINEDFHVWMRMLEAGAAVAVRQVAFFYRVSPGSLTSDLVRYFEGMAQSHGEWMQRIWPELDDHERRTYRDKVAGFLHSAAWQHSRNGRISAAVGAQLRSLRVRALWEDILAVVRTFIRAVVWRASSLLRGGSRA